MKQNDYQDIFSDYEQQEGSVIDISNDEGVWKYIDARAKGIKVSYGFHTGQECSHREIRTEIKCAENVFIYGAGSSGGRTLKLLRQAGKEISGFIDSSKSKQGTFYLGKRVYDVSEIKPRSCIILSCGKYKEVCRYLSEHVNVEEFSFYVDFANSLFYSKEPLEHMQLIDFHKEEIDG